MKSRFSACDASEGTCPKKEKKMGEFISYRPFFCPSIKAAGDSEMERRITAKCPPGIEHDPFGWGYGKACRAH
jgi:hypothetical protein